MAQLAARTRLTELKHSFWQAKEFCEVTVRRLASTATEIWAKGSRTHFTVHKMLAQLQVFGKEAFKKMVNNMLQQSLFGG